MSRKAGIEPRFDMMAEKFKSSGYATEMLGKWHVGWCKKDYLPNHRGFDNFLGIYHSGTDHYNYTSNHKGYYDLHLNDDPHKLQVNGDDAYSTNLYGDRAAKIIKDHDPNTPLFLYVAFQNIHGPMQVPETFKKQYRGSNLNRARKLTSGEFLMILSSIIGSHSNHFSHGYCH